MSDLATALSGTPWANWQAFPLAGDASARRYTRLQDASGDTVIVMESGPVATAPFIAIAGFLQDAGLAAPAILMDQSPVLVISDLGTTTIAKALDDGADPAPLYDAAVDVLIALHAAKPPDLHAPDWAELGQAVAIATEYYAPDADPDKLARLVSDALQHHASHLPRTMAMRDCHAENLIWRPDRVGTDRIGLLDFQDAVLMPAGYDLVSLLRDVRRDVPDNIMREMTRKFCAGTGLDTARFGPAAAAIGAQRNLRILGVFGRLIRDHDKTSYAQHLPGTWRALQADLSHPALADLKAYVDSTFPQPQLSRAVL